MLQVSLPLISVRESVLRSSAGAQQTAHPAVTIPRTPPAQLIGTGQLLCRSAGFPTLSLPGPGSRRLYKARQTVATQAISDDRIVICGAGVIGASVAYYLSQLGVPSTLVERAEPACASSGKAGGFLARDWLDDGPCEQLCRRSYHLHADLAAKLGGDLGFRKVTTAALSLVGSTRSAGKHAKASRGVPDWVDGNVQRAQVMSGPEETAQVHPRQLTLALIRAAERCKLRKGTVTGIRTGDSGQVTGVQVGEETLPAFKVVLAMGPWTGLAARWLPGVPQIVGQLGHSVVLQAQRQLSSHCFFVNHSGMDGVPSNPEVFVRPNGEVYVVEGADIVPLPEDPLAVEADTALCDKLQATAAALSSELASAEVTARQACYRPLSQDGVPVIGAVPGSPGAFVASGHSCWGILNSLATGEALASLIATGTSPHVDLAPFDPARFQKSRHLSRYKTSHR